MTIKLGVIGLSKNGGWAATDLIPPILQKPLSDRYAITAVSTSSSDSASASASHYSNLAQREIKAYHGSAEAISADPDVDLVVVSINVAHHAETAMHAINAGKDVFVECPLGRNLAEGRSLMQAARQANVRAMVGLQGMNIPAYVKAREWIDSNKIGRVLSVSWYMAKGPEVPLGAPWTFAKYEYTLDAKNGATFLDIVVAHTLSTITHILGPLQTVNATNTMGHKEIILADTPDSKDARTVPNVSSDQFSISGIFESGALFSGQWVQLGKALLPGEPILVLKISGTEGNIRIESEAPFLIPPPSISLNGQKFDLAQENLAQTPTGRAWEAFANKEEGSYATFEDGVYAQALIAAIRKSDEEGRRVSVSEI